MDLAASRRPATLAIAIAAAALALLTPAAEAASLSSARAVTPRPAAATTSAPQGMSIEFTARTARVVGPGALVEVRCAGTSATACVGSLAIEAPGEAPAVAFSIDRGEKRTLVVPLGEQRGIFDGMVSVRSRVVAQTLQAEGGSLRTARMLRFE